MKRNENVVSFIKPLFTWRTLYVLMLGTFLYCLTNVIFTSSSEDVCGNIKQVYKEEGCGCSSDTEYNYYAYIISEDNKVNNVEITKEKYDNFVVKNNGYFCGEKTRSNYYWCLALTIVLGIVLLICTINIFCNESWSYKPNKYE